MEKKLKHLQDEYEKEIKTITGQLRTFNNYMMTRSEYKYMGDIRKIRPNE